jgi:hypothetical protein
MITKLKEWLLSFFRKEEKRIKLDLRMDTKPAIQRVFLDNYDELETHGWYIVRLDTTDGRWEVITGPEK